MLKQILFGGLIFLGLACDRRMTTTSTNGPQPAPNATPGTLRYLALGDSYTIGESVEVKDRYPMQLAAVLRSKGIDVADPTIIARTGWTTDELSAGIDRAKPAGKWDLVTLLIGVNNQYRGRSPEQYRGEFAGLLKRSIAFAGEDPKRVIVISIPDWGATPFAAGQDRMQIAREIDTFNAINQSETEKAGAKYVDITPGSRNAATDRSLVAEDGLHPSGKMYAEWAAGALPLAADMLSGIKARDGRPD